MEFKKITRIILPLILMAPVGCFAAGLGEIQVDSSLNQPFDASIPVVDLGNVPPDAVTAKLASEKQFTDVGLIKDPSLSNLVFNIVRDKQQRTYIQVSTTQPISQPVMTFLLQLNWPGGQVMREFTVFLDPSNYAPVSPKKALPQKQSSQSISVSTPAPAPARTYGPTTSQDNLWEIANQNLPNSNVSTAQMMIAIVKLNPHAFVKNNINGLKSGYVLKLPTATQATAISDNDAQAALAEQNQSWQNRTQTTVLPSQPNEVLEAPEQASIPSAPSPVSNNEQENIPLTPTNVPAGNATPMLPVATLGQESDATTNESGSAPTIQALENEVSISAEAMQASTTANQSLQQEVKSLQSQVQALQQQLSEKNQQILMLEKMNAEQTSGVSSVPITQPTTAAPTATSNGGTVEAPETTKWYFWPLLLALVLLALLVGIFAPWKKINTQSIKDFFQRFNKKTLLNKTTNVIETIIEKSEETLKSSPIVEQAEEMPISPASLTPISTLPNAAMLDIVDEADVYIAYGRYEKAESLIKSSLTTSPQQPELRIKLLEIYFAQKNKPLFDEQLNLLPPLPELAPTLQTKITKLINGWENEQTDDLLSFNAQSTAAVAPELTPAPAVVEESIETPPASEFEPPPDEHANRVLEFDGDLSTLYSSTAETVATTAVTNQIQGNIFGALKIEQDAEPLEPEQTSPTELTSDTSSEQSTATADKASSAIQTNLDLAQAYYDMGDFVEALGILQAIVQTGNDEQKKSAQELIERINHPKAG